MTRILASWRSPTQETHKETLQTWEEWLGHLINSTLCCRSVQIPTSLIKWITIFSTKSTRNYPNETGIYTSSQIWGRSFSVLFLSARHIFFYFFSLFVFFGSCNNFVSHLLYLWSFSPCRRSHSPDHRVRLSSSLHQLESVTS